MSIPKRVRRSLTATEALRFTFDPGFTPCNLRFLNDGSWILVVTQRHKLGMTKPIGSRPLQEFHLNNSLEPQPNAFLHPLRSQFTRLFDRQSSAGHPGPLLATVHV